MGCIKNGGVLVLPVPWNYSEKLCLRKNTFLHVKRGGDPSVLLHHITASENIINSSPNYLTISKLYF